jgi:hypothetical protein
MNKSSSVLINRLANRTIFANIVEQKKAVADGKQLRVTYITDNTNTVLVAAEDGAVETTVAEYTRYIDGSASESAPPTFPDPPTGFAATSASGEVILTFTPGSDGGSPITNYMYSLDNGTSYSAFSPATGPITGLTISGLTNGTTYSIKLLAVNAIGESTIGSDTVYITPLPGSALRLFLDGAFVDPSGATWPDTSGKGKNGTLVNGPVRSTDNSGAYVFDGSGDYVSVPAGFADVSAGITILTFANFGASKDNWERLIDFGTGEQRNNILFARAGTSSNLVFEIYNGVNQPISLSKDLSGGIIENGWGFYVARLDGSRYLVKNQNVDASGTSTVLPVAVNRTLNYIGKSNWADEAFEGRIGVMAIYGSALTDAEIVQFFDIYKARYFTVPAAPTGLSATAGDGQVSVAFTAGADGGTAITNYQYSTDGGATYSAFVPTDTASPVVITGLTNGTSYSIKLRAVNAMGAGAASAAVSATPVSPIPSGNVYISPTTTNLEPDISLVSPFTGGGYSYNFNGTSDYLTISGDNSWAFGTGAFTIEWFQYQTDNNDFPRIFATATDSIGCSIESGTLYPWLNGDYPISVDVNDITPDDYKNKWIHFAIVRDSNGTLNVYKDGNSLGSGSDTTNITNNISTLFIGVQNNTTTANTWFGGYLTNIRIVKGLAVYTGNFTVPTSALTLTASANPYGGSNTVAIPSGFTKLLLTGPPPPSIELDPGNVASYSGSGTTITSIGTSSGVSGTLSNVSYNAGSGGYLTFAGTGTSHINFSTFNFGTAFTLIAWVRPIDQANINTLFANTSANQQTPGFKLGWNYWVSTMNDNSKAMWYEGGNGTTGSSSISPIGTLTVGTWQQVAYVLNQANPEIDFYKNGTLLTSSGTPVSSISMNRAWRIGNMFGAYAMKSDVGLFKIYPAILTTSEILAEYNATKSRYGL